MENNERQKQKIMAEKIKNDGRKSEDNGAQNERMLNEKWKIMKDKTEYSGRKMEDNGRK